MKRDGPANGMGFPFPAVIEKIKTQGVLNPLLWVCGLTYGTTAITAYTGHPIVWLFGAMSLMALCWTLRSFDFFREREPRLMQSEKFQLEYQKLQAAFQTEQHSRVIEHSGSAGDKVSNPHAGGKDAEPA